MGRVQWELQPGGRLREGDLGGENFPKGVFFPREFPRGDFLEKDAFNRGTGVFVEKSCIDKFLGGRGV